MDSYQEGVSTPETKTKKSVERSAAYPTITIEDALNLVSEVYKHFRNNFAKRDDILELIEGCNSSKIAACGHYGLLNREKDTYQVSELYKTIVNHLTEVEKVEALLCAFISPNLNKELTDKFDGDILPEKLAVHLYRFHRITENAAPFAADIFLRNAKYVGILSDENKLCYNQVLGLLDGAVNITPAIKVPEGQVVNMPLTPPTPVPEAKPEIVNTIVQTQQILLPETTNEEKLKMKLTGSRWAYLSYPRDLNGKDIEILKLQLDALALTI